jgi:PTS system sucrose-specific IIC component
MITILITGLATFIFVGPIMRTVSDALTNGILWLYSSTGIFGGAVFGFFYSLIVVTGLHQSFPPVELALFEKGGSFIFATASMANVAQGAACLAVFLLMKKKSKLRALAGGSSFSALLGITEPAIFGVTLRMRFPFFIGMCATAVSGALISYFHVVATALGAAGLLGFVSIKTQRIPEFFLCMVVSFVLSFGATYAYGKYRLHKGRCPTCMMRPLPKDCSAQVLLLRRAKAMSSRQSMASCASHSPPGTPTGCRVRAASNCSFTSVWTR